MEVEEREGEKSRGREFAEDGCALHLERCRKLQLQENTGMVFRRGHNSNRCVNR